jgi:hypothetical protein
MSFALQYVGLLEHEDYRTLKNNIQDLSTIPNSGTRAAAPVV